MLNNYPDKTKNQHEHLKFSYKEYLDASNEVFVNNTAGDSSADVEIEMASSLYVMRREFKRTVKKLRNLYTNKEPKVPAYEFENVKSLRARLAKNHAIG